ncbi:hypothetical protein Sste5346_008556 [Sporothrix stenoceras]|uniref:Uncharacterized protein n=1 Tax=Sporothrix stenoceras TaxID=5173 RepID=A0ABR3YPW0_9PEZI
MSTMLKPSTRQSFMDSWQFESAYPKVEEAEDNCLAGQFFPGDDFWSYVVGESKNFPDYPEFHTMHDSKERSVPLVTADLEASIASPMPEYKKALMHLPEHIRKLPPHLRAKEKALWEAANSKKGAKTPEMLNKDGKATTPIQDSPKKDTNSIQKPKETREDRNTNDIKDTAIIKPTDLAAASPTPNKTPTMSPKQWVVTGEKARKLSNGRVASTARLRLVNHDDPLVDLCAPDESKTVKVKNPFDDFSIPTRKEWFTPSPDPAASAAFVPLDLAPSNTTNWDRNADKNVSSASTKQEKPKQEEPTPIIDAKKINTVTPTSEDKVLPTDKPKKAQPTAEPTDGAAQVKAVDQKPKKADGEEPKKADETSPKSQLVPSDEIDGNSFRSNTWSFDKVPATNAPTSDSKSSVDDKPAPEPTKTATLGNGKQKETEPAKVAAPKVVEPKAAEPKAIERSAEPRVAAKAEPVVKPVTKPTPAENHQPLVDIDDSQPAAANNPLIDSPIVDTGKFGPSLMPALTPLPVSPVARPSSHPVPPTIAGPSAARPSTAGLSATCPSATAGPSAGPAAPAGDSASSIETAVESIHTSAHTQDDTTESDIPGLAEARAASKVVVADWVQSLAQYGPKDWNGIVFTIEDPAAAKTPRGITATNRRNLGNGNNDGINRFAPTLLDNYADSQAAGADDRTELSGDRNRLPTLKAFGNRTIPGFANGKLPLGAFRFQHDDAGPTEPTGPLQNLRMTIMCNFARHCREAEHSAIAQGPDTILKMPKQGEVIPPPVEKIDPSALALCRRCGCAQDFVMRPQHGRLFLETVLLPLSEAGAYTDMIAHVNTCIVERIYAEGGMEETGRAPTGTHWQDIKAMPIYEDYEGALILASHKYRVMSELPMEMDAYGFLFGRKDR